METGKLPTFSSTRKDAISACNGFATIYPEPRKRSSLADFHLAWPSVSLSANDLVYGDRGEARFARRYCPHITRDPFSEIDFSCYRILLDRKRRVGSAPSGQCRP